MNRVNILSFRSKFSLVFSAALISGLGDGLIPIAFALQAHRIDHSGRGLTFVLIALWAGRFLSSLVVGKLPPPARPAVWMLGSDVVRMLAQWLLVLWVATRGDSIAAFAVSSCVYGCASSFFTPARFGLLSLLFADDERTRVNGSLAMLGDILFIAGPLIGTAAVLTLGFRSVLLIDGATFLVAMMFVVPFLSIRSRDASATSESELFSASDSVPSTSPDNKSAIESESGLQPATKSNSGPELDNDMPNADASDPFTPLTSAGTAHQATGADDPTINTAEPTTTATEPTASQSSSGGAASAVLPRWVRVGLGTWLVASVVNGFLGSAGPTWIMNSFDEKSWGFMATASAVGSLAGSAATIAKTLDRVRFSTLQFLLLLLLAGQVLALAFSPVVALIFVVGGCASLFMTASGIAWDSLGQSLGSDDLVHQFATKDQLVFTAGTPLGMVLFAVLSDYPTVAASVLAVALVAAAVVSCLPAAQSPRTTDISGSSEAAAAS